ncbi:uncharacterized protein MYCFIDRAFT_80403 [Pseudocercospora fijiensis CIRAD86]|uniref:MJ1316 RNA cyclic group end recognition domain-containing protein n=1 Tax=Pseudocercospora fijiensis (strain CIRAD86) TaxID=383855 RepID=M3B058_PSEFD|nr:uncharacterized protein MYCFIDRAFT_80403 [Pseudocercospora fijiensis CIRAD86]EME82802.1 hypothetical protein MYCFIDRAFT_80403 [Pseudocercospora fijiensis CIRAD86]
MADFIEKNEAAIGDIRIACQHLANRLDFVFWQVLREKLELPEDHPMPDTVSGKFELRRDFGRSPNTLNSLTLTLRYCGVPSECHDFPWQSSNVLRDDVDNWTALDDIEDAQAMKDWMSNLDEDSKSAFRSLIIRLTTWAVLNGLMAADQRYGLLTVQCLIWMVHDFADLTRHYPEISDVVTSICVPAHLGAYGMNLNIVAARSRRSLSAHISAEAGQRLRDVIDRTIKSSSPVAELSSVSRAREKFFSDHQVTMALISECWTPHKQKHYHDLLITASTSFQEKLREAAKGQLGANIWPAIERVDRTTSQVYLGLRIAKSDTEVPDAKSARLLVAAHLDSILEAVQDECRWDRDEALLDARILTELPPTQPEHSDLPVMCQLGMQESLLPPSATAGTRANSETSRFLDAAKAISKLRWDPRWNSLEWEIGYEDRFDGLMWKNLEDWQAHTEEEDFIPTHRVRQIRLRESQEVYWNRDTRDSSL